MAVAQSRVAGPAALQRRGRFRPGDAILYVVTLGAALIGLVLLILIAWKVLAGARPAMETFGLGFLTDQAWDQNRGLFGARSFIFGTVVTSLGALLLATPISIAIALFLTELAPGWIRSVVGPLVELLAAVPTVVLGLWGILVLGPFIVDTLGPALHGTLGWIPIFGTEPNVGSNMFAAILILTIMMVPIISSLCRELFLGIPNELKDGSLALGATRWEMVRGVVFPYARAGIAAAMILGPGTRDRRGDRGHPGDRQQRRHQHVAVRPGRHAGEPDREPVPGRRHGAPGLVPRLPRASSSSSSRC